MTTSVVWQGWERVEGHLLRHVLFLLLIGIGLLSACVPKKTTVTVSPGFQPSTITKVAVLPFQALRASQKPYLESSPFVVEPVEIRSQFSLPSAEASGRRSRALKPERAPGYVLTRLTNIMYASLDHRQEVRVLPSDQVVQALEAGGLGSDDLKLSERVRVVGSRLEVDAVLVGLVRTYREREGSKFGATGAMVGMEIHLVDSKTGVVLWTGEYFEEQKPLTEDFVGFFEHGGTFVTADVLAKNGLRKLMKELPVGR